VPFGVGPNNDVATVSHPLTQPPDPPRSAIRGSEGWSSRIPATGFVTNINAGVPRPNRTVTLADKRNCDDSHRYSLTIASRVQATLRNDQNEKSVRPIICDRMDALCKHSWPKRNGPSNCQCKLTKSYSRPACRPLRDRSRKFPRCLNK
jgi:hypothetical protein